MTKRVSDLTKEELDYWVAKAQGWEVDCPNEPYPFDSPARWKKGDVWHGFVRDYSPSTNGGQAMELVEEYDITLHTTVDGLTEAKTYWAQTETGPCASSPDGYKYAICRAVIASHYGDEVPDDEL